VITTVLEKGFCKRIAVVWVSGGFWANGLQSHKEDELAIIFHLSSP